MSWCQHCSGAQTTAPCPSTLFDETTASHITADSSCEDSPELLCFIANKELPLHQCSVSCILLTYSCLSWDQAALFLCITLISKPSCHMIFGGKWREVGAPHPPAAQGCASSQRNELWFSLLLTPRYSTNTLVKTRSEPMQVFPGGSGAHRGIFPRLANPNPIPIPTAPSGTLGLWHTVTPTALCPSEHSSLEKGWELQTKDFGRCNERCWWTRAIWSRAGGRGAGDSAGREGGVRSSAGWAELGTSSEDPGWDIGWSVGSWAGLGLEKLKSWRLWALKNPEIRASKSYLWPAQAPEERPVCLKNCTEINNCCPTFTLPPLFWFYSLLKKCTLYWLPRHWHFQFLWLFLPQYTGLEAKVEKRALAKGRVTNVQSQLGLSTNRCLAATNKKDIAGTNSFYMCSQ